jgi:membrane protein YdbS with pleckstrin-like domain
MSLSGILWRGILPLKRFVEWISGRAVVDSSERCDSGTETVSMAPPALAVNLNEYSVRILLCEYDRLKGLEKDRIERYESIKSFFVAAIAGAAGLLYFMLDKKQLLFSFQSSFLIVAATVLCIGIISFLGLLGKDVEILQIAKRYKVIRNAFSRLDPGLENLLATEFDEKKVLYHEWSSFWGILQRGVNVAGNKTIVAAINSFLLGLISASPLWNHDKAISITVCLLVTALMLFVHVGFSVWRYKFVRKGYCVGWWI